jgi:metallo-beta-lactamase family protein
MPAIIISASGMATGGRVLHHLKAALPDSKNTVLFVGYQAAGTRGRQLVDGEKAVKIHGQIIPVQARVELVESMSAHADSVEILRWLGGFTKPPRLTFIVHGEPVAMEALAGTIHDRLGWITKMPEHRETVDLA